MGASDCALARGGRVSLCSCQERGSDQELVGHCEGKMATRPLPLALPITPVAQSPRLAKVNDCEQFSDDLFF